MTSVMSILWIVLNLLVTVAAMIGVAGLVLIGPRNLWAAAVTSRSRLRTAAPYLGALLVTLGIEKVARDLGPELSWVFGLNLTGIIYAIEGEFVGQLQLVATPALTAFLSFVYIEGYVFLLVFPIVAYFALPSPLPLKRTALAYTMNYGGGLILYVLFIAYGPRNLIPDAVDPLLYSTYPSAQLLTSQVNTNTNVFPSLHTSLSTTVALLAYRSRDVYPGWCLLAVPLAVCVGFSTMYLGIHWAIDVVAGVLLGVASVYAADAVLRRWSRDGADEWSQRRSVRGVWSDGS